nr:hypothetical protein [Tanacetum cinerariifolium]
MTSPSGFSTPPQIPNINTSERPPVTTTVFAATTPKNTPFAYCASTLANPNPMLSLDFIEANYEDYEEKREMEPRSGPTRETTPPIQPRSPKVRRQRERVVGFEKAPNREGSRAGRNAKGSRPLEIETRENGNRGMNLPPILAAYLGRNESSHPLQSFLTSVYGGHQPTTNTGGISLLTSAKEVNKDAFSSPQHQTKRRLNLRTISLVEHLSIDLPSTYKGLMEKTYTWIEAREVATNEAPSDRKENFKTSKKSSWDDNRGQKGKDRFSPYRGPNHRLLSSLSKSPREILATEKVARSFEQPPLIMEYLVNISKRRAFWSLNEDILKIIVLTTNTSYPSRKIRRIRAYTHQRPRRKQAQYAVSSEDQYAVLEI